MFLLGIKNVYDSGTRSLVFKNIKISKRNGTSCHVRYTLFGVILKYL